MHGKRSAQPLHKKVRKWLTNIWKLSLKHKKLLLFPVKCLKLKREIIPVISLWWGCGATETFIHCWCPDKMVQSLWNVVWLYLLNLNLWTSNPPFLGMFTSAHQNTYLFIMNIRVYIHNSQNLEITQIC